MTIIYPSYIYIYINSQFKFNGRHPGPVLHSPGPTPSLQDLTGRSHMQCRQQSSLPCQDVSRCVKMCQVCMYVCIDECMHACMYVCICVCVCLCLCICICIHVNVYIYKLNMWVHVYVYTIIIVS